MLRWCFGYNSIIPSEDIEGIKRINISPVDDLFYGVLGTYTIVSSHIHITWCNPYSIVNPLFWLSLKAIQKTLYHEIGHHAKKHSLHSNILLREDEAEDYASLMLKRYHPVLAYFFVGRAWFRWSSHIVYDRLRADAEDK